MGVHGKHGAERFRALLLAQDPPPPIVVATGAAQQKRGGGDYHYESRHEKRDLDCGGGCLWVRGVDAQNIAHAKGDGQNVVGIIGVRAHPELEDREKPHADA